MAHVSDFTKSDEQIILDLINYDNETNLAAQHVTLGTPIGNPSTQQVSLTVSPVPGGGYTDTVDVTYNRLNIQAFMDVFFPEGFTLQQGDAVTIGDLLDEVNIALGVAIDASHIVDGPVGEWQGTPNEVKNVNLVIANSCRTYYGQAVITLDGNDIALDQAISVKTLSGLNLPVLGPSFDDYATITFSPRSHLNGELVLRSGAEAVTIESTFARVNGGEWVDIGMAGFYSANEDIEGLWLTLLGVNAADIDTVDLRILSNVPTLTAWRRNPGTNQLEPFEGSVSNSSLPSAVNTFILKGGPLV